VVIARAAVGVRPGIADNADTIRAVGEAAGRPCDDAGL